MYPYSDPRLELLPPRQRRRIIRRINGKAFRHLHVWLTHAVCLAAMFVANFLVIHQHYPFWAQAAATGLATGGFMLLAQRVQAAQAATYLWAELDPACLTCGYDLTGNTTGICPECGSPVLSARKSLFHATTPARPPFSTPRPTPAPTTPCTHPQKPRAR